MKNIFKKTEEKNDTKKYEDQFLTNRLPANSKGKVVYIRPEHHEVLIRLVQLSKKNKTTLYAYIDNILEQHLKDHADDIKAYFQEHFKPIL
ncbi:DUF3408 domain-containing protein [Myroides marinus]|uniref:DUF3408 domain-containing protein n=1 Tax=Myroides TaxID=76831 RepID=UPI002575A681|nr:DUF3408 domain-containing protein [Myroides marinus]MDM1354420.1 DUF3408 domain-containing protein [Myroides marinus]MDM1534208.1 DUF3408 domain-containing protein [Myroides marinus]MDM1541176.1 DUF3408 domain-containing protein [Myroides marinus]